MPMCPRPLNHMWCVGTLRCILVKPWVWLLAVIHVLLLCIEWHDPHADSWIAAPLPFELYLLKFSLLAFCCRLRLEMNVLFVLLLCWTLLMWQSKNGLRWNMLVWTKNSIWSRSKNYNHNNSALAGWKFGNGAWSYYFSVDMCSVDRDTPDGTVSSVCHLK